MIKLFLKVSALLLFILICDVIFGVVFRRIIEMSPDGRYYKADYSLSKCTEDIVVFGSSRAETNFVPYIFEEELGLSAWNTGRGGQLLPFWCAMQAGVLSNHNPKIVVVNIERDFLNIDLQEGYERAGFLRPFYHSHPEIREIIDKCSRFENLFMTSNFYAFNSSFYYLLRPFLVKGLDGDRGLKGWKTRVGEIQQSDEELIHFVSSDSIEHETLKLFNRFINSFLENNCKVFLVVSPNYNQIVDSSVSITYASKIEGVTLMDFSNDKNFIHESSYYKDPSHLNSKGAIKFSHLVSSRIIDVLNN